MLTMGRILEAQRSLASFLQPSALVPAPGLAEGVEVYLKAENLQKTGSFKVRGASFRIAQLTPEEKKRGVIACSAGNHAQGVALAAQREGIRCIICMPEAAPLSKVERTRAYGAEVILCPGVYDDCYQQALALQEEHGYIFVHPFDDEDVIAGQGTVALEILNQLPHPDAVIVPAGGGGLITGMSYVFKQLHPACRVIGVEAAGAASMKNSVEHGRVMTLDSVATIADGIAVKRPGERAVAQCRTTVDEWVTVSESEIASAILTLLEDHKMVAEGAGAVSVAAVMHGKVNLYGKRTVCVVSGGNVDVNLIGRIISKGLYTTGRVVDIETTLDDRPNQLRGLLDVLSRAGANILSVSHDRETSHVELGSCVVRVRLETRGREHVPQVLAELNAHGYIVRHW